MNLAQDSHGGWSGFWANVWNAEWAANVGLPLLVAVLAVVAAGCFVKRQFKHDRELVQEERNREFARELAAGLRGYGDALVSAISGGVAFSENQIIAWKIAHIGASATFEQVQHRAQSRFRGDAATVELGAHQYQVLRRWDAWIEAAQRAEGSYPPDVVRDAILILMRRERRIFERAAQVLEDWNGENYLPSLAAALDSGLPDAPPIETSRTAPREESEAVLKAFQQWCAERGDDVAEALTFANPHAKYGEIAERL